MRKGRATKLSAGLDLDDDGRDSGLEEIGSDVDDLKDWLATRPDPHLSLLIPRESMVRKFLPPGTVSDLYETYRATQKLLGAKSVSQFGRLSGFVLL